MASALNQTPLNLRAEFDELSRLFQAGRLTDANRKVESVLAAHPENINFLHVGGLIKQNLGEFELAEKMLATAFALRPEQADLMHNLAVFYQSRNKVDQAAPLYEELLKRVPEQAHVWANYGHVLRQQGKLIEALAAFEKAQQLDPAKSNLLGTIAMTKRQMALWDGTELPENKISAALAPVFIADPKQHLQVVQKAAQHIKPLGDYKAEAVPGQGRIRIGYLSNDLHEHATSYLIAELFGRHDRDKFEVFVYSYGPDDKSFIRSRLKQGAEHWVECGGKHTVWIAERIFRDRINILVDLKGYTRGGLPELLAARPANIIMQWLGYPGSMGAGFVDYMIADHTIIPERLRASVSEKIIRMPHSYQINDSQRPLLAAKSRADYKLPEQAVVLCCFNQPYKITPPIFDIWTRILKDEPETVLWLFAAQEGVAENLRREATQRGVEPARLIFAPRLPQDQHIARYQAADIVLDTSPYGGHTTTSDALWAGAPVVGLMGESFAARVSASLLRAARLDSLIAADEAEYEMKIRQLINDPALREKLSTQLVSQRKTLPLFDSTAFVKALETGYARAWQGYCNNAPAVDIDL